MRSEARRDDGPRAPVWLRVLAYGGLVFLHFPILMVGLYAFNTEESAFSFPLKGLTLRWFQAAAEREDVLATYGPSYQAEEDAYSLIVTYRRGIAFGFDKRVGSTVTAVLVFRAR